MMTFIRCAVVALMLTPALSLAQDFDVGLAAAEAGDFATALREWTPLAEQGNAAAQTNLGIMYANGDGVAQDYVTAHMWFNIAAASGSEKARENREMTAEMMIAEAIAEAQQRAKACMESNYKDCD